MSESPPYLIYSQQDAVVTLTMNQPEVRNARRATARLPNSSRHVIALLGTQRFAQSS
jgi:1,4-dihydroxy-2-naphthoyl-CoA synthase